MFNLIIVILTLLLFWLTINIANVAINRDIRGTDSITLFGEFKSQFKWLFSCRGKFFRGFFISEEEKEKVKNAYNSWRKN
jgi:hypothetical protein